MYSKAIQNPIAWAVNQLIRFNAHIVARETGRRRGMGIKVKLKLVITAAKGQSNSNSH